LKTVVFAFRDLGVSGLEALLGADVEVSGVYTHEPGPDAECYRSVSEYCSSRGLDCRAVVDPSSEAAHSELGSLSPDLIFVFDYQTPLGTDALGLAPGGVVSIHLSLLPAYHGPRPVVRALIDGAKITGATLHYLVPGGGIEVCARSETHIGKKDTGLSLYKKLSELGGELLSENLPLIKEGKAPRTPLGAAGPSEPIDGRIDWLGSSWQAYNKTRALTRPHPGAHCRFMGERMTVWRAEPDDDLPALIHPGEVQVDDGRALVGTSYGGLRLVEVEWRGALLTGEEIARELEPLWREKFE